MCVYDEYVKLWVLQIVIIVMQIAQEKYNVK